jgi:YD repeat-containing protein
MSITSRRYPPFTVNRSRPAARSRRLLARLQILIFVAGGFVWFSTGSGLVSLVQAGGGGIGGGGGSGCSSGGSSTANITYIYDSAGRLHYVVDPSGHVVTYTYDNDGNIQQVAVTQPSGITIDSVSPHNGSAGTSVTIFGTGFSTTCQNTVSFNGTIATVTASSATTISTTVPTGATTGVVSVNSVNGPTFTVQ